MKNNTRKTRGPSLWVLGGVTSLLLCVSALGQYSAQPQPPKTITIYDNRAADVYPSVIDLSKSNILGKLERVEITLNGLKHGYANDVGVLLVSPLFTNVVLMNNVGGGASLSLTSLNFSDGGTVLTRTDTFPDGVTAAPSDAAGTNFFAPAPPGFGGVLNDILLGVPDTTAGWSNLINGKWQLFVQDSQLYPLNNGALESWTLKLYTSPLMDSISSTSVTLVENQATAVDLTVALKDSSPPSTNYTVKLSGAGASFVDIVDKYSLKSTTGTISLKPKNNAYCPTTALTLTFNDGFSEISTNINVTVEFRNQTPTVKTNAPVLVAIDQGAGASSFSVKVDDVDNSLSQLKPLTITSSDATVVDPANVFYDPASLTGSAVPASGSVSLYVLPTAATPGTADSSSATLTITVSDTNLTSSELKIPVQVKKANHPVFANGSAITLSDSVTNVSSILVSDVEGVLARATVSLNGLKNIVTNNLGAALEYKTKNATNVIRLVSAPGGAAATNTFARADFVDGGNASLPFNNTYVAASVAPKDPISGLYKKDPNATWSLYVTNGGTGGTVSGGWVLNLWTAPIIKDSADLTKIVLDEGNINGTTPSHQAVTVTFRSINGHIGAANWIWFDVNGDNPSLLTVTTNYPTIVTNGTGSVSMDIATYFKLTGPQYGTNTVTVHVKDNNGFENTYAYVVEVPFQNHQPGIDFIQKQVAYSGRIVGPIAFTATDVDWFNGGLQNLDVTVTSSADDQKNGLPNSNIFVTKGPNGRSNSVLLYPIGAITNREFTLTVNVNDKSGQANAQNSRSFTLYIPSPGNPLFANAKAIDLGSVTNTPLVQSAVTVTNLIGAVRDVQITLFNVTPALGTASLPISNLNFLVVSPSGKSALVSSHVGGTAGFTRTTGTTMIYADAGQSILPTSGSIAEGVYPPAQNATYPAVWPIQAPFTNASFSVYNSFSNAFKGLSGATANGTWTLYVLNDGVEKGTIASWQLSLFTDPNIQTIATNSIAESSVATGHATDIVVGDLQPGVDVSVTAVVADPYKDYLTVTPVMDQIGQWSLLLTNQPYRFASNIMVTVTASTSTASSTANMWVHIYQVALAPVVSQITTKTTTRGLPTEATFTAWDPQNSPITPGVFSYDGTLVPNNPLNLKVELDPGVSNPISVNAYGNSVYQYLITMLPAGDLYSDSPVKIDYGVTNSLSKDQMSTTLNFDLKVVKGGPLFANTDGPIGIPVGYPVASNATPHFPSVLNVSKLNGYVTDVRVTLNNFTHTFPQDVCVMLVNPDNTVGVVLMAHAGGGDDQTGARFIFDDKGAEAPAFGVALQSGRKYKPMSLGTAPIWNLNTSGLTITNRFAGFTGGTPNGDWKLYVMDDANPDQGSIGSWLLAIETSPAIVDVGAQQVVENTPTKFEVNLLSDTIAYKDLNLYAVSANDAPTNLNWTLVNSFSVTNQTSPGGSVWNLWLTPTADLPSARTNVNGTVDVNLFAYGYTLDGSRLVTNTSKFTVTVLYSNQAPRLNVTSGLTNQVDQGATTSDFTFTFSDPDSTISGKLASGPQIKLYAENSAVVSKFEFKVAGYDTNDYPKGTTYTVDTRATIATQNGVPVFGTNKLYFVVSDEYSTKTQAVTLEIKRKQMGPQITNVKPATPVHVSAGTKTPVEISFDVWSPDDKSVNSITVKATSGDPAIIADANITQPAQTGATRTIKVLPSGTANGALTINLKVGDGTLTNTPSIAVVVDAPPAYLFGNGNLVTFTNIGGADVYYPVVFDVTNLVGMIESVSLEMRGFQHVNPANLDIALVSPDDITVMLMSGAGGSAAVSRDLTFANSGVLMSPTDPLQNDPSKVFKASYYTAGKRLLFTSGTDGAPQSGYKGDLAEFQKCTVVNNSPSKSWRLYISDTTTNAKPDLGQITGGMYLTIVTKPNIVATPSAVTIAPDGSKEISFQITDAMISKDQITNYKLYSEVNPTKDFLVLPDWGKIQPDTNGQFKGTFAPPTLRPGSANFGSNLLVVSAVRLSDNSTGMVNIPFVVSPSNYPPVIYRLLPVSVAVTEQVVGYEILVSSPDSYPVELSIKAESLNEGLIGTSNLVFTASTNVAKNTQTGLDLVTEGTAIPYLGRALLTITPNPYQIGTANIKISVTDPTPKIPGVDPVVVTSNLVVTVSSVVYKPVIKVNSTQVVAGSTRSDIPLSVADANSNNPDITVDVLSSSNESLVKKADVKVLPAATGKTNSFTALQITAQPGVQGAVDIVLQARDTSNGTTGDKTTLTITVIPTPEHNYAGKETVITIRDKDSAAPYPATIDVSGLSSKILQTVVTINGFSHTYPKDVGMLLVSPDLSKKIVLMNQAGGGNSIYGSNAITLVFNQTNSVAVPRDQSLQSTGYKPADYSSGYVFPTDPTRPTATSGTYSTSLDSLAGMDPNGTWLLYVVDQVANDSGMISNALGAWKISFITQPVVTGFATNYIIAENGSTNVSFTVTDDSPADSGKTSRGLTFGAVSSKPALLPNANITFTTNTAANPWSYAMQIVPARNQYGTNVVTVYTTNASGTVVSSSFSVQVPYSAQPSDLVLGTNVLWMAAGSTATNSVTVTEPSGQFGTGPAKVTWSSTNETLVPSTNITWDASQQSLVVRPVVALTGTTLVTVTVRQVHTNATDLVTNATFVVNVTPTPGLFGNGGQISINDFAAAQPYPSSILVSGVYGKLLSATVKIVGMTHSYPHDITMVLVGPNNQKMVLMTANARNHGVTNLDFSFSSLSSVALPVTELLTNATYAPPVYTTVQGTALYANLAGSYTNFTAFTNMSPNGTWSLYVQDDAARDFGAVMFGWTLQLVTDVPTITAPNAVTVAENDSSNVVLKVTSSLGTPATNLVVTPSIGTGAERPIGLVSKGVTASTPDASGNVTLHIAPAANYPSYGQDTADKRDGTANITLTVSDPGSTNTASASIALTVTYINQGPTLPVLGSANTAANVPLVVSFTVADPDSAPTALTPTISAWPTALFDKVEFQKADGYKQYLAFYPNGSSTGTADLTVTVTDSESGKSASQSLSVTVGQAVAPVISQVNTQTVTVGASVTNQLTVTDTVADPSSELTYDIAVAPVGLATAKIVVDGGKIFATVDAGTTTGTASVTVTATDKDYPTVSSSMTYTVVINPPELPVFAPIGDTNTWVGQAVVVPLMITPKGSTTLVISNTFNSAEVDLKTVGLGSIVVTPAPKFEGNAFITVSVWDGYRAVSQSFTVHVVKPSAPTLALISDISITAGKTGTNEIAITAGDVVLTPLNVIVAVDPTIATITAPDLAHLLIAAGTNVTSTTVVVSVDDGYNTPVTNSFKLTVTKPSAPTIEQIADQTLKANTETNVTAVVHLGDLPASALAYSVFSSDTRKVTATVSGAEVTLHASGAIGKANVDFVVNDQYSKVTNTFIVTVVAPVAPSWSNLPTNQVVKVNTSLTIDLGVASTETAISNLVFDATFASNVVSSVVFSNNGAVVTATLNVLTNTLGSEDVTLTMQDGYTNQSQTFTLTVVKPVAPTIGTIAAQTTTALKPVGPIALPIVAGDIKTGLTVTAVVNPSTLATATLNSDSSALTLTPSGMVGNGLVTVSVSDGWSTNSTTFSLTVTAPAAWALGAIADQSVKINETVTVPLSLTPGDMPFSSLVFSATPVNSALVKSVVFANDGKSFVLTATAVKGETDVTISIADTYNTVSRTFHLTVKSAGQVVLAPIPAQTTLVNTPKTITLSITSPNEPVGALIFGAFYDSSIVSSVLFDQVGNTVTATLNVVSNKFGSAQVTIQVQDSSSSSSQSFLFTVAGEPVKLAAITDKSTIVNVSPVVQLNVTSTGVAVSNLTYTATSSDTSVVTGADFTFQSGGEVATIKLAAGKKGTANVTITVTDGVTSAQQTFKVTVVGPTVVTQSDANVLRLGFAGRPGDVYIIQKSTDLIMWSFVREVTIDPDGEVEFDYTMLSGGAHEYFRSLLK